MLALQHYQLIKNRSDVVLMCHRQFGLHVLVAADRDDCGCATGGNCYTAKVMDLTYTVKNTRDGIKGDVAEFGTMLLSIISRFRMDTQ